MYHFGTPTEPAEQYHLSYTNSQEVKVQLPNLTNKYVFVKQNFLNSNPANSESVIPKVLVNPNFTKKVFVNPNFNINTSVPKSMATPKIHVNPKVQKLNLDAPTKCSNIKKIHINPNVLRNVPVSLSNENNIDNYNTGDVDGYHQYREDISPIRHTIVSTRTKLIRSPLKYTVTQTQIRKRRSSVCSKFKIVRSSIYNNSNGNENKNRLSLRTKYKIIKSTCPTYAKNCSTSLSLKPISKFKLDNRRNSKTLKSPIKNRRYVYVNRFISISDIARNNLLKQGTKLKKNIVNISGVQFKRSPNCLRRTSDNNKKPKTSNTKMITLSQSKYKFVRKSLNRINSNDGENMTKQSKVLRITKAKKNASPGKLRKCNIPCPYYRKFGRCKGKDNGKCYRKHDPDQIALCTKFLQGACVDENCLLSHNVSPEKMPTCKFYLEGSCSRDDCPYLHVRISPKAEICKDFLEGFCRKATECDKRHQFLCPDFEKHGKCQKQRCPYPHGKMVRKYSVFTKNKFAKKSSDKEYKNDAECYKESKNKDILLSKDVGGSSESLKSKVNCEVNVKTRYYIEPNLKDEEKCPEVSCSELANSNELSNNCDQENCIRSRPKLGKLPSFIAFEDV